MNKKDLPRGKALRYKVKILEKILKQLGKWGNTIYKYYNQLSIKECCQDSDRWEVKEINKTRLSPSMNIVKNHSWTTHQ